MNKYLLLSFLVLACLAHLSTGYFAAVYDKKGNWAQKTLKGNNCIQNTINGPHKRAKVRGLPKGKNVTFYEDPECQNKVDSSNKDKHFKPARQIGSWRMTDA